MVRSREDKLVGVVRGGSVGVRARVPEPAGGVVQSGDGSAEIYSFRLVSNYKAVDEQVEKSLVVMPNQEADIGDLLSARFFGKLYLLQVYWQMPLAEEAREIFTITTPIGLFTLTRVPQGVLNATAYFQGVMAELLVGIKCKIWVDYVFFYADTEDELLDTIDEIWLV